MTKSAKPMPAAGIVKSAGRVLAVLEAFQTWQRPVTAKEVSRTLKVPRSSTNALLSSLVTLGYLGFDQDTHCYFPTLKVGLLGDWLIGSVRGEPVINAILQDVSSGTGETTTIAVRSGFDMQFVTIIPSTFPIALNIAVGAMADLFESAVGIAWFAAQENGEIERIINSRNRQHSGDPIQLETVMVRVADARERGAAAAYEKVLPDTGAIAVAYPRPVQGQTVVIGIGGPQDRIRRSESRFTALMNRSVRTPAHRVRS